MVECDDGSAEHPRMPQRVARVATHLTMEPLGSLHRPEPSSPNARPFRRADRRNLNPRSGDGNCVRKPTRKLGRIHMVETKKIAEVRTNHDQLGARGAVQSALPKECS